MLPIFQTYHSSGELRVVSGECRVKTGWGNLCFCPPFLPFPHQLAKFIQLNEAAKVEKQ